MGKIKIELTDPHIEKQARKILTGDVSSCSNWEILCRVVQIAIDEGKEVEFYRKDPDEIVTYDLKIMLAAIRGGLEPRPRNSSSSYVGITDWEKLYDKLEKKRDS